MCLNGTGASTSSRAHTAFPCKTHFGRNATKAAFLCVSFTPAGIKLASNHESKKSWREKLADEKGLPKVAPVCGNMAKCWSTGVMVIPVLREVDALMKLVPRGKLTTINELRAALAK